MKKIMKNLLLTAVVTAMASTVQADSLFGKIFGSSDGANFETLMSHVPADTAYIWGNKKPIPEDVMDFHMKRAQDMWGMIAKMNQDDDDDDEETEGEKNEATPEDFLKALLAIVTDKLKSDKLEDTGLSLEATSVIYGYDMSPVVRLTFTDKDKIMAAIKEAEEKSKFKVTLSKCGAFDCFISPDKDDKSAALVITNDHLAASVFSTKTKMKIIAHLAGDSQPENAYPLKKWDTFLETNSYKGFGDGYIDLHKVYDAFSPEISEGMARDMDKKQVEGCMSVIETHVDNVPEVTFGIKTLDTKSMDYELVVKTSTSVSDALQTLANKDSIAQRVEKPIFDLGFNLDPIKLRDALTQYSEFLITAGKDNGCKNIDEKEVRENMGGLQMVMNMGLKQVKSFYIALKEINVDERMTPKDVDIYLSVGTDDPMGLFQMAGMFSPDLAELKIPADGSPVAVPASVVPPTGVPMPPLWLSRSASTLNLMIGNDKPALIKYSSKVPEIMTLSLDGKRYYEKLALVLNAVPQPEKEQKEMVEMMETMGDMIGNLKQEIFADKRGLVVNYHVDY